MTIVKKITAIAIVLAVAGIAGTAQADGIRGAASKALGNYFPNTQARNYYRAPARVYTYSQPAVVTPAPTAPTDAVAENSTGDETYRSFSVEPEGADQPAPQPVRTYNYSYRSYSPAVSAFRNTTPGYPRADSKARARGRAFGN